MKIAFIIGSCELAGGNYVVLQHAAYLQEKGHEVSIVHLYPNPQFQWHSAQTELSFLHIDTLTNEFFDIALATWWGTVYHLPRIQAKHYSYFVQSIESWYCQSHLMELRRRIDITYTLPLPIITEAGWIKDYLEKEFGRTVWLARNGIRKDLLQSEGPTISPRPNNRLRVLVEGPIGIDFKNVARTIRLARKGGAHEIWWLTSSNVSWFPGVDRVFSRIPVNRVGEVYRSCHVLLKLSHVEGMFGPPLEMFHCGGTAVVYAITGADEYIKSDINALAIPENNEQGVIAALQRLQTDYTILPTLCAGALATAEAWPDWAEASATFGKALEDICTEQPSSSAELEATLAPFAAKHEVTIPVLLKKHIITCLRSILPSGLIRLLLPIYYWAKDGYRRNTGIRQKTNSLCSNFKPKYKL